MILLFVCSNLISALCFLLIPILLLRSRVAPHRAKMLRLIGLFVLSNGVSHVLRVMVFFEPGWFWLLTISEFITASISLITVWVLRHNAYRLVELPNEVLDREVKQIRMRIKTLVA